MQEDRRCWESIVRDALDALVARLDESAASRPSTRPPPVSLRAALRSTFVDRQACATRGERATLTTGVRGYDEPTGGLRNGELTVILASGAASIRLAVRMMIGLAADDADQGAEPRLGCFLASASRSSRQLSELIISDEARVSPFELRRGAMTQESWGRLTGAATRVGGARVWIDSDADLATLRERFLCVRNEHSRIGLIVVDGIEQLGPETGRTLLTLARDLNVPIVAAANRDDAPLGSVADVLVSVAVDESGRFHGTVKTRDAAAEHPFHHWLGE